MNWNSSFYAKRRKKFFAAVGVSIQCARFFRNPLENSCYSARMQDKTLNRPPGERLICLERFVSARVQKLHIIVPNEYVLSQHIVFWHSDITDARIFVKW